MAQNIHAEKKEDESFENLLRRFNKRVQHSGILVISRQLRYFQKPKNKREEREDAARREESRKRREELRKSGKF